MEFKVRQLTCPMCFSKFVTASNKRKFCSAKCRKRYRALGEWQTQRSLEKLLTWKKSNKTPKKEEGWPEITII